MQGYQCHKNMWLSVHRKELIPKVTPELQALFDQGNKVTEEARKRFPNGVLVDLPPWEFVASLKKTRELLAAHTEFIFEAAFEYKGCYARADVIAYNAVTQRWSIIEVKSTTKVKDEHLDDVGLQVWIMANAGLPIEKISILHLNNACKFPDMNNLFIEEDVTDRLRDLHTRIAPRLNEIFSSLRIDEVPPQKFGAHCFAPRECQFIDLCRDEAALPEPNIFDIPGFYKKRWELFDRGLVSLDQVPEAALDEKQKIQVEVLKGKKRFVDRKKVSEHIASWKFPLIFLDFETINPAVPHFDGTSPFQQVPFQFSVHILDSLEAKELRHIEFLQDDGTDPRSALVPELLKACAGEGSVVAYYGVFEAKCIQDLEDYFPAQKQELAQIRDRSVDPLPVFKDAVYDAAFKDSFSIKSVGPAILGEQFSYENMAVGDGSAAQRAYTELAAMTPSPLRNQKRQALLDYCKKDTLIMVELVKWLYQC